MWLNSFRQVLHVNDVSPLCINRCVLRLQTRENFFKKVSHAKDIFPVCVNRCVLKLPAWANFIKQVSQMKNFSPECVSLCLLKVIIWMPLFWISPISFCVLHGATKASSMNHFPASTVLSVPSYGCLKGKTLSTDSD